MRQAISVAGGVRGVIDIARVLIYLGDHMQIMEITQGKSELCERILRALPDWFGIEQAIIDYAREAVTMPMCGVVEGEEVIGFVSLRLHNEATGEIYVMGILPEYHRKGLGQKLVEWCEAYLVERKRSFLTVKTLSPSRESAEYERTRKFYEKMGFLPLEEFKTLWGEANPCLFMAKVVEPDHGHRSDGRTLTGDPDS
jgi:ribosomal protein S18 acetylase RimI-like enzyme